MSSSKLKITVSDKIKARLSKPVLERLERQVNGLNELGKSFPGKNYNIGISEAYTIANNRNIVGSGMDINEMFMELDLKLHGAPPMWIIEHPEFKDMEFEDNILPRAFTLSEYCRNVNKLLWYLNSEKFYDSFQAVYYGEHNGNAIIP